MWLMLICAISSHIAIGILQIVRCISVTDLFVCITWRLMILYNIPQLLMQHVLSMNNNAGGQTMSVMSWLVFSGQGPLIGHQPSARAEVGSQHRILASHSE
jgi:hypothetical protein